MAEMNLITVPLINMNLIHMLLYTLCYLHLSGYAFLSTHLKFPFISKISLRPIINVGANIYNAIELILPTKLEFGRTCFGLNRYIPSYMNGIAK